AAVVGVDQAKLGRVFAFDRNDIAALEPNQMLLEAAPFVELHPLLNRRDWSPARIAQTGNELRRGNKRVARTDAGHRLSSEDRWSQDAKLLVGQFDAFMDGNGIIILSEHIWPFVHGFCFRSRSDRWCAIEPRGEGLGGGVRGQCGAQRGKGGEQYIE